MASIFCIDTHLSGHAHAIAAFMIPYSEGAILIDPGPASTLHTLRSALADHDLSLENITDVLLTHIHLDHAGAAGHLAQLGAQIHVHPAGARHLQSPEKLLASARRIYGERMDTTWGDFQPVPAFKITEVQDGEAISIKEVEFKALHTPGHADHHCVFFHEGTCFSGDIGGVRRPGRRYVRLPFVPPETHLGKWRESLKKIQSAGCKVIAITHFGIFEDAPMHLHLARQYLDEVEQWLEAIMPRVGDVETLQSRYVEWMHASGQALGVDEATLTTYDFASPVQMAASGLFRYWHKVRMAEK